MEARAEAVAAEGVPCGSCLTDSRRAIRGELDLLHAPLLLRLHHGLRPSERIVAVAQRIQVWHPLGNESSMVGTDPSANSGCSVCNCTSDEDLLLLCELCDMAVHTYCVGLGTTVPEGDWFCKDCATSKEEHSEVPGAR